METAPSTHRVHVHADHHTSSMSAHVIAHSLHAKSNVQRPFNLSYRREVEGSWSTQGKPEQTRWAEWPTPPPMTHETRVVTGRTCKLLTLSTQGHDQT